MGSGEVQPQGESLLRRVRIVLVRPRGSANVGAVARAMKNMGLGDLALVAPALQSRAAAEMAVHARDVLDGARRASTLAEAVADCRLVIGTTCRPGLYRSAVEDPDEVAPLLLDRACAGPVALVFGPEDHGLTNQDLRWCQRLVRIDTSADYPSLNLSHAVLLCCHALRRAARARREPARTPTDAPPAEEIELMLGRLQAALLRIGFLNPQNPEHIMLALRRLFGRTGLERHDVRILLGIARQIDWYARTGSSGDGARGG